MLKSLQTPQLQPTDTLKVGEELRNALARQLPSINTQHHQLLVPHREKERGERGEHQSVCRPNQEEEKEGIICGTTLRAEPSATALLLPDHNQMCQVCPNRNDCVKAIFSNLSDFRVPPRPHERQILMLEERESFQTPMNAHSTLCLQHSHVMRDIQYDVCTHRGKTRPVAFINNHPPNIHASGLPSLPIQMCSRVRLPPVFQVKIHTL